MSDIIWQILAVSLLLAALLNAISRRERRKLPPSPPSDPFIGHARIFPMKDLHQTFEVWGRKYGDMVYVHVLSKPFLIVNSLKVSRELLDKRGANYSDRPKSILYNMMDWKRSIFNLPYGDRWKTMRRLIAQSFTPSAVQEFHPLIRNEVLLFLRRFETDPRCFKANIHRMFSSMTLGLTYGIQVHADDDRFVQMIEHAAKILIKYPNPGGMPVDFLPFLRHLPPWFPGAGFVWHARYTKHHVQQMCDDLYSTVKHAREAGTARASLVAKWQEDYEKSGAANTAYEEDLKMNGFCTYLAGVETTESVLLSFFLMMVLHPNAAKSAQKEIDHVVEAEGRLPNFEDRARLPFVECVLRETYRTGFSVPINLPHTSLEEDVYNDMVIPAETTVITNIWTLMNDESVYPNPSAFIPERFLDPNGLLLTEKSSGVVDPRDVMFGFGRRICPGNVFADAELWLTVACILAVYDIRPPVDPISGRDILPKKEFISGITIQPKPFGCLVIPRSEKHLELLREARILIF